jgi:hypothetical protein
VQVGDCWKYALEPTGFDPLVDSDGFDPLWCMSYNILCVYFHISKYMFCRYLHVPQKFHLIREIVRRGDIKICKVHMYLNVVDPLTKPLPQPKHEAHMRVMGIRYILDYLK